MKAPGHFAFLHKNVEGNVTTSSLRRSQTMHNKWVGLPPSFLEIYTPDQVK
ncbi:unnamed protein product [Aphanomyces euteiches]